MYFEQKGYNNRNIFIIVQFQNKMFVGSTFLGSADRLSIKSILTGKTGSFFGLFASAALIVICFVLFIGPVIFYFKGDYVQGIFTQLKNENLEMYSGCDYKLAISIYSKATGQIIDLNSIKQIIQIQSFYVSPDQDTFTAAVQPCNPEYFAEMENKPHQFKPGQCYIIPNGLGYFAQYVKGYLSVIGFKMNPVCEDPFTCTFKSSINGDLADRRSAFYSQHYYVLRFTGNYLDQLGNVKKKFYQMYSTEWQSPDTLISQMWAVLETSRIYLDNSIMPWYNNQTLLYTNWNGEDKGRTLTQYSTQSYGVGAFFVAGPMQRIFFRQYKKLDWLLGMLGGGILLLYIIFWTVCNFVATTKQKYQNCESTTLVRYTNQNAQDLFKPKFNIFWFISNILPFNLPCFKQQNRIINYSQKFLDIAELIKKLKVASKNLKKHQFSSMFEPRILQIYDQPKNQTFTEEQIKYQMKNEVLQQIRNDARIPQIYEHHLPMLALCQNQQSGEVKKKIQNLMKDQIYSKYKVPKFQQKQRSSLIKVGKALVEGIQKFLILFDVFGAKPNLCGRPLNFSIFGCILTLIIIILSIFTFALTLKNMGVTRTYWDTIYVNPEKQNVQMVSGVDFKLGLCFNRAAFQNNLVLGQDRVVKIKFYQYKRNGTSESYQYFDVVPIKSDSTKYFDQTTNVYQQSQQTNCFRPDNGLKLEVYGDPLSQTQAYLGYILTPYCSGTPVTCASSQADTNAKFFNLLNMYPIFIYLPQANYFPDVKKIAINAYSVDFALAVTATNLNFTRSVDQTINLDTLQLIDDWAAWTMGEYPKPKQQILTTSPQTFQSIIDTSQSSNIYYNIKVSLTGRVQRVIFNSYKIDFLFATIGGCFAFYFFFFGCFGKAYNTYQMKVKLAEKLYNQEPQGISGFKAFLNWARIKCCKDQIIKKIQNDLDCVQLAKNVDNVYRLSVVKYNSLLEKNLGLIYLKERIKEDQPIIQQKISQDTQEEDLEDDFQLDWDANLRRQKKKLNPHEIENISQSQQDQEIALEKEYGELRKNAQHQSTIEPTPSLRSVQKCGSLINDFDFFSNNAQFTLDGKRSIKSVCGGVCCIILFIFICVLTSHFLTVYFSDYHQVSLNKVSQQEADKLKMSFEVGQNFKLAVSFYKMSEYNFLDVRNLTSNIGLSMIKYTSVRNDDSSLTTTKQYVDLISCPSDYLNGFVNEHQDPKYFANINLAYCIPDGTKMNLYGSADDKKRQYFSIKMYNKFGSSNTTGLQYVTDFLKAYLPMYHISSPTVDFRSDGKLRYSMKSIIKSYVYQTTTSRRYNITLVKNLIQYDTAVNPTNERPSLQSYQLRSYQGMEFYNAYPDDHDRSFQLNFYAEDNYNQFVVKKIKANEIFGIVGGCVALLFLGIGALPRSFNEYKLRYMIGSKLYMIMGKKKTMKIKNTKGKPAQIKHNSDQTSNELSEWRLFFAWVLSFWGFLKNNYNTNHTLRMAALIQSRASKDINIFQFMKTLRGVQNGIKKMKLNQGSQLNLCRVYPKQIVAVTADENDVSAGKQLIKTVRDHHSDLIEASRVNKFSEWELNILVQAKQNGVDISKIFNEKWLDKFMGISRSSMGSSTRMRSSQNRTTFFKRSVLPSRDDKSQNSIKLDKHSSSHVQLKQNEEEIERSENIVEEHDK